MPPRFTHIQYISTKLFFSFESFVDTFISGLTSSDCFLGQTWSRESSLIIIMIIWDLYTPPDSQPLSGGTHQFEHRYLSDGYSATTNSSAGVIEQLMWTRGVLPSPQAIIFSLLYRWRPACCPVNLLDSSACKANFAISLGGCSASELYYRMFNVFLLFLLRVISPHCKRKVNLVNLQAVCLNNCDSFDKIKYMKFWF